jgi:membrane protein
VKNQISTFIKHKIWEVRLEDRRPLMAFLFKQLRIVIIVSQNFTKDKLQVQAASLTYYTLLSVVPLIAMAFAVAKGFGFEERLEAELTGLLKGHEDIVDQLMVFATRTLENTQGGVLAGVGVVLLFWSVMRLLISIEMSFNAIWQVAKSRSWIRKFTEYLSIMLIAPIMIIVSSSITVLITSEIESLVSTVDLLKAIGPVIYFFIRLIPYALIWLLFTFVYMAMPNTKVNFGSALIAGIIAGTAFQLVEWGYIHFQVGVSKYNAIYGSFAALPLFLIWVNISWLITLIGAEIAYANQYVGEIKNEIAAEKLTTSQFHIISMMICKRLSDNFESGREPESSQMIANDLNLPFGITAKVLDLLKEVNLLTEVELPGNQLNGYLPSRNISLLKISEVFAMINDNGEGDHLNLFEGSFHVYLEMYEEFKSQSKELDSNRLVKDLPWPLSEVNKVE